MSGNFFCPKNPQKYLCEKCDYFTCSKKDFTKHVNTLKHKKPFLETLETLKIPTPQEYICDCGKIYHNKSGLWKHKKKCSDEKKYITNVDDIDEDFETDLSNLSSELLLEVLKQNNEFKELLVEQNKQIIEQNKIIVDLSTKVTTTINNNNNTNNINSHNKTFNLQLFLNEKCKDAMNIDEFVDSLKLTFNDLESVGELGFVKGISRIFINGLRELDVYKRPIHCSDLKREVMHLKEDGVWSKDNDNKDSMKKLVKMIANKNINKIYEWKKAYPSHRYSDDPKNDIYLKFLSQSMGAKTKEEDIVFYEKVIKNVAKEVTINKNNV